MIRSILIVLLLVGLSVGVFAEEQEVVAYEGKGVLVDIQNFFEKSKQEDKAVERKIRTGYMAFVTEKGVYSFLEKKDQEEFLKDYQVGDSVEIKGKFLAKGFLLEIAEIKKLEEAPVVDQGKYQKEEGKEVELEGVNKCQCGLKVGTLSHDCKLGHLHHLQTADGSIYHYLEAGKSKDMKKHFKKMKVKALVFSGNFIKIIE